MAEGVIPAWPMVIEHVLPQQVIARCISERLEGEQTRTGFRYTLRVRRNKRPSCTVLGIGIGTGTGIPSIITSGVVLEVDIQRLPFRLRPPRGPHCTAREHTPPHLPRTAPAPSDLDPGPKTASPPSKSTLICQSRPSKEGMMLVTLGARSAETRSRLRDLNQDGNIEPPGGRNQP